MSSLPAAPEVPAVTIPPGLLPRDGRFGSGPSKVRPEQVAANAEAGSWTPTSDDLAALDAVLSARTAA